MKLWEKGYQIDHVIETFMTGDDPRLDQALIPYDCMGSIAHAKMLNKIGILSDYECHQLITELENIIQEAANGEYVIEFEDEDVHTSIENALTKRLGNVGKKLHTARSRNDQILLDTRLFCRDQLSSIKEATLNLCQTLLIFAEENHDVPYPGRTHFQRAMPSSMGLWAGAFLESFLDDCELLKNAYWLNNQCPLGSAASYGVSLPIDRQYCSELLGFRDVQNNVLYANNSRGKFEAVILNSLTHLMNDLCKMAGDIIIFSAPEFNYLTLPEKFCPGSSLMPQKRNPCPLELIRAKSATVQSLLLQILEITRTLPSGYNRDFQETKRPLMDALNITSSCLIVFNQIFSQLQVQKDHCIKAFTPELFATDHLLSLTSNTPFRDAYKLVALNPNSIKNEDPVTNILSKTHIGAPGNLGLDKSRQKIEKMTINDW